VSETASGSCYCGAVRFEVDSPSVWASHCHCDNCRRAHAAAIVSWIGYPRDAHRFTIGAELVSTHVTETAATRSFCSGCGSPLLYVSPRWPDEAHVPIALLDSDPDKLPSAHVYSDRSPSWSPMFDDLPRLGGPSGVEPL
jgi:hypothetical protein